MSQKPLVIPDANREADDDVYNEDDYEEGEDEEEEVASRNAPLEQKRLSPGLKPNSPQRMFMLQNSKAKHEATPEQLAELNDNLTRMLSAAPIEKPLHFVMAKSRTVTTLMVAQALYCAITWAKISRLVKATLESHPDAENLDKLDWRSTVNVGIIGCGRIGRCLLETLLQFGVFDRSRIFVSTRRPETLKRFAGVHCHFDNVAVASKCQILFICVLPSQILEVIADIKRRMPAGCLVYSMVGGYSINRLAQQLCVKYALAPDIDALQGWKVEDYTDTYQSLLSTKLTDRETVMKTCSLFPNHDKMVKISHLFILKLFVMMIYLGGDHGITHMKILRLANMAVHGKHTVLLHCLALKRNPAATSAEEDLEQETSTDKQVFESLIAEGTLQVFRESFLATYRVYPPLPPAAM
eukprot:Colp12_sorted_trinity150504_noHs@2760